jgi:hypothetical protein
MASAIYTNIVKLRTSSHGCLPFKANDHENKPYVGISRMRRFIMVDMCKGKRKLWLRGPMTSSLSDCTWLEKEWKFRLSTMWHPSLHFIFLFFHLIHPSHNFIATPLFSFSFFSFILSYYIFSFFLSFFSILILFSLFSLYWQLFKALNSYLSCMHTIWSFK